MPKLPPPDPRLVQYMFGDDPPPPPPTTVDDVMKAVALLYDKYYTGTHQEEEDALGNLMAVYDKFLN